MAKDKLDQKEVEKLRKELQGIANKRFGCDDDGDRRVEVGLVDRTRFERSHFSPILYDYDPQDMTPEELDYNERIVFLNAKLAFDRLDTWSRCRSITSSDAAYRERKGESAYKSKMRLCALRFCSICDAEPGSGLVDSLGFIHYNPRSDPPTVVPKDAVKRHVITFVVREHLVTWVAQPYPFLGETPKPYGTIEQAKIETRFQIIDGKIVLKRPEMISAYVAGNVLAVITNPDPNKPIRSLFK